MNCLHATAQLRRILEAKAEILDSMVIVPIENMNVHFPMLLRILCIREKFYNV